MNSPPSTNVQLTDEDIKTIKSCRQISFWRGSIPFTIGALLSVTLVQKFGYFTNRPKLRIPSYVLATIFGYLGGKLAYLGECKRMFLQLNDSRIKDQLLRESPFSSSTNYQLDSDHSPIIVNTPVDTTNRSPKAPMTYAERRQYYRNQSEQSSNLNQVPNQSPQIYQDQFSYDDDNNLSSPNENTYVDSGPTSSYFDKDRPYSSFFNEDNYRPKE